MYVEHCFYLQCAENTVWALLLTMYCNHLLSVVTNCNLTQPCRALFCYYLQCTITTFYVLLPLAAYCTLTTYFAAVILWIVHYVTIVPRLRLLQGQPRAFHPPPQRKFNLSASAPNIVYIVANIWRRRRKNFHKLS
jgi:hypothetical protein